MARKCYLKSQVGLLQTAHSWATAGVLLSGRMRLGGGGVMLIIMYFFLDVKQLQRYRPLSQKRHCNPEQVSRL